MTTKADGHAGMDPRSASYILGYELGRALVLEARDLLQQRAERRHRTDRKEDTPAARASYTLAATSRLIRRIVYRSRRDMAMAALRRDRNTVAWHVGHIDGARSVLL